MLRHLLPKQYGFFELFERHAKSVLSGVKLFQEGLNSWPDKKDAIERVEELEHECDSIVHMTVDLLHRTFITPIDREQILQLTSNLDDIIDLTEAAAQRLLLFGIEDVTEYLIKMSDVLVQSSEYVLKAVELLRDLDKNQEGQQIFQEIHRLENEGDKLLRKGLADLFSSNRDVMCVIKLKEIYETIEAAIDACEHAANLIDGILLEHS